MSKLKYIWLKNENFGDNSAFNRTKPSKKMGSQDILNLWDRKQNYLIIFGLLKTQEKGYHFLLRRGG